jgi:hypothetical protein
MNDMFSERKDKIMMMNMLAVTSFSNGVRLLTLQVMDTHFHVIASGTVERCSKFTRDLVSKLNIFINKKGRTAYSIAGLEISMDPITEERELLNKIIYVYRNAIAAGFPLAPWEYEWGPGNIYFIDHSLLDSVGKPLRELPLNKQYALFHSRVKLPQGWRINDEGMILPHCFVDWGAVEHEFKKVTSFLAFLYQKSDLEARYDNECKRKVMSRFSIKELRKEADELCCAVYGHGIAKGNAEERLYIAKELWRQRRTYDKSYLARATLVPKEVIYEYVDEGERNAFPEHR